MESLIVGTNGNVLCVDPGTGRLRWQAVLKTGGLLSSTSCQDVSVLLRGPIVYAGCAGHLFCIDAASGGILWHNPLDGFGHNDISLAMEGTSVQFLQKTVRQNSS